MSPIRHLKRIWVALLCILLTILPVGDLFAQEQKQQQQTRKRGPRWKGPEIGSVIKDFELPILGGGKFKLSDYRGKIVIIELGACT